MFDTIPCKITIYNELIALNRLFFTSNLTLQSIKSKLSRHELL